MHLGWWWCFGFLQIGLFPYYIFRDTVCLFLLPTSLFLPKKKSHLLTTTNTKVIHCRHILKCEFKSCKKAFIHKQYVLCVCCCIFYTFPSFHILSWISEMDCKICYFKNNTHKPDSSITVFPRVRYRLEKVDAWHNCNHNQIAIHLKYFSFYECFLLHSFEIL